MTAVTAHFAFEFRVGSSPVWYPSPHLIRPEPEANLHVARMNMAKDGIVYRSVPAVFVNGRWQHPSEQT